MNGLASVAQRFDLGLDCRIPHVLFTPTNAAWLKQAKALLEAFSTRYLIHGSWCSRSHMAEHILGSKREYNPRADWNVISMLKIV